MADDLLKRMTAQRDRLSTLLEAETDGAKAAALSRELRQVLAEVDRLTPAEKRSKVDEVAAKRAERGAAPADSSRARRRARVAGG